jgi:hypothetical protein
VSGKLSRNRAVLPARSARPPRSPAGTILLVASCAAALLAGGAGCRAKRGVLTRPAAAVDAALQVAHFAPALRKLGRAHLRGTARFEVGLDGGATDGVTTEADIWMDDAGNWRLVELNDKDGGREVVFHGHELAIALRYGKMIRRPAEDPEPLRLLQEAVGAPFAAWDLLRDAITVDDFGEDGHAGRKVHVYKLTKTPSPPTPAAADDAGDRRAWRRSVVAKTVEGTILVDNLTGAPLVAEVRATYTMRRGPEGTPMHGAVNVRTSIEEIGQSPAIAEPEAENLAPRQRTVPDERALLGGLPRAPLRARGAP